MKKFFVTLAAVLRAGLALAEDPGQAIPIQVPRQLAYGLAQASVRTQIALTEVQP